ncbi:putative acetyltransferase, GNAT family [Elsinoe ampelina]|uniref:Putative acetyltransferase, GNAT family n=1 Tax=Elsinoe ampelina TaxID=302913 RepID=A0A6A6G5D2_9PEZI|nr:putative acetyltransferase, GNAT family [Elsinoe ampelina]
MTSKQPTLRTPRLELVPLTDEHRENTKLLDMDPEVMKMVAFGRPFTEEETQQMHSWLTGIATSHPGLGTWAGMQGGQFVGWWVLAPIPTKDDAEKFEEGRSEFGFRVCPKFWGQGYAKEGAREMIRYAFEDLGLSEVVGETMTINAASRAVMAGVGLTHVETFFRKYDNPPSGIEEGEVRYTIRNRNNS